MEYDNKIPFEYVVQTDPTLNFFLREAKLDFDLLEHQTSIMASCVVIAINRWIDLNYS